MGKLPPSLKKMFCDQFVMEEWRTIGRLFEVKMVEFWAQIWTIGAWRTSSQVSSNNISKYLVLLFIWVVVWSDTHVLAKWLTDPGLVTYRWEQWKAIHAGPWVGWYDCCRLDWLRLLCSSLYTTVYFVDCCWTALSLIGLWGFVPLQWSSAPV